MPKGEDELDRQGKYRCPGSETTVPSDPLHFRISAVAYDNMRAQQSKSLGQVSGDSDATRPSFLIPRATRQRFVARLKMERLLPLRSAEGSIRAGPGEPGGSRYQANHCDGQVMELAWNGGGAVA